MKRVKNRHVILACQQRRNARAPRALDQSKRGPRWRLLMLLALFCLPTALLNGCSQEPARPHVSMPEASQREHSERGHQPRVVPMFISAGSELGELNTETTSAEAAEPAAPADPRDWPYWRGPHYNNTSYETGLVDDWNPKGGEGSHVAWKREDLGTRSTPIVMDGKLYVLCRAEPRTPREGERVVCLDAKTGKTLWTNRFNVWLSDVPDTRVGWSSVVGDPETGNVYALGVCGYFQCLDGQTGETLWAVPLHERFGLLSTYGGRTNFPVVFEDLVIVSAIVIGWGDMAKPAHRFLAFDKRTGEVVWFTGTRLLPYDTTYSAPALAVLGGRQSLVIGSGDGQIWSLQPRTGLGNWHFDFSRRGINTPPVVDGQTVYASHSEENNIGTSMGGVVALDGTLTGDISENGAKWRVFELMAGKSAPLVIGDRLYIIDDRAKLHILDKKTGEEVVRRKALGTVMRSSPLYADGKIYCITEGGRWYILKPDDEKGVEILSKGRLPSRESCAASPIVSHGRLYITTSGGIYCVVDPEKESGIETPPKPAAEPPVEEDQEPATMTIVPTDVLLRPGEKVTFRAKLFNARGQFLKYTRVQYELEGPGAIDSQGVYTAPADAAHVATIVRAKVGDVTGRARIRIVPPLPWKFTFDDLDDAPITWVGARYRHVVREIDGNKVLVKITTIPKGTRSRCWFGQSDLTNYTIEADVMGAEQNGKMPDIGLIAQGYTLDLQGANQKLQIRTWVPQLRMAKTVDFSWKPNTWYRMKLQASVENGRAVLRGKVWPKGTDEPSEWTVEATDAAPNRKGSPGLYGNAKDAEIYLDNIEVYHNS